MTRRKTVVLAAFALAVLSVGLIAGPAGADPNNKNTLGTEVLLDCGAPIGSVAVRPAPGGQISAWNVETGVHYIAKAFFSYTTVEATIVGGGSFPKETQVVDAKDTGAEAPAAGRTALVECTNIETGNLADLGAIDAETAAFLNALYGTSAFAAGQELEGSYSNGFVVQVMVPGKK